MEQGDKKTASKFNAFANDSQMFSCGSDELGEITIENGLKEIQIHGEIEIKKNASGLANVTSLVDTLISIRDALSLSLNEKKVPKP